MEITKLQVNHMETPLGMALESPVFSWITENAYGKRQKEARLSIRTAEGECIYDSGRQKELSSLGVRPTVTLAPRCRYIWQVEVWSEEEEYASAESWFETGKRQETWQADWIGAEPREEEPILCLRFETTKAIKRARLYASCLGIFEWYLDGVLLSTDYLAPFYQDYNNWLQSVTYPVEEIQPGMHILCVMLGNGWYKGRFGFIDHLDCLYGDRLSMICELHLEYRDGGYEVIGSSDRWRWLPSPVRASSIYDGEEYDARMLSPEQLTVDHERFSWDELERVVVMEGPKAPLLDRRSPQLGEQERLSVKEVIHTPKGETVLDFGQNMVGYVTWHCREEAGTQIHFWHGEILQNGNFYNENLRTARAEFQYIASGEERLVRPHFTFYGFRYVKVEGISCVRPEEFYGSVVYSRMPATGAITTSNPKVNRLFQNAFWGQKGNFLDVPTDCPQRDERMGWTGDAQVFCPTACFNMDTAAFYDKFLFDMRLEQEQLSGAVPHVVPDILDQIMRKTNQPQTSFGSCAWGDAATVIPWTLYEFYGDRELLGRHYRNMKLWTDYIRQVDETKCGGSRLWKHGFHYADWLALDNPNPGESFGGTDPYYVASAYYYRSARLTALAAGELGLPEETEYHQLAEEVREAFRREYFTEDGICREQTQTACLLALQFELAPESARESLMESLRQKLKENGMHLNTGFVGTPILCKTLSEYGQNADAYTLLLQEDYPSWLYPVNMGATTIWERWNSVLPNGMISDTGMNSLNHYAYGSVVEWMYRYLCGFHSAKKPGWKQAVLRPMPDPRMQSVSGEFCSASGCYKSSWEYRGETEIRYELTIPFDASAVLYLPWTQLPCRLNGRVVSAQEVAEGLYLEAGSYQIEQSCSAGR